jgi:two-component system, NtrC family, response regulator AtoC
MQKTTKILIVDDEAILRESLRDWLVDSGHNVSTAENAETALKIIRDEKPAVAVIDLVLPGEDGIELLTKAKQILPEIQVVMITAYGSVPTAIAALKAGAYDYIEKPFSPEKVELLISKLIERQTLLEENLSLRQRLLDKYSFENIVTKSAKMQKIIDMIKVVAASNAPVLISGESGTGKELVARAIHAQSYRNNKPFVVVSCGALPESLVESEFFGHESEAVNGTITQRRGKFEIANKGTLFMDEVGDLDLNVQVHLLRVLEEKAFYRAGSTDPISAEVRLISATNKDLNQSIESGTFREDLFYRLSVVNIALPPLRERKEDIPILAEYFLRKYNEENSKKVAGFSADANEFLSRYEWPGNIRELENAIERAVILARNDYIEVNDISQQSLYLPHKALVGKTMLEVEKNHILSILIETGGNCSEAARILGISRMTLYNKIKAYDFNISKMGNN